MLLQLQCDPRPSHLQVHESVVFSRCLIDHLELVTVQPKLIVDGPLRGITDKCQAWGLKLTEERVSLTSTTKQYHSR